MQFMRRLSVALVLCCPWAIAQSVPPDVFLITVDTLRADRVIGEAAAATRGFSRLAADGIVFTQAFTPAPLTNTSHTSILTGLYPAGHGVYDFGMPLAASMDTLAEVLKSRGYRTAAFIGALVLDSKSLAPGLNQGFETYWNFPAGKKDSPRWGRLERRAADVFAEAERWLVENPRGPRFVWVHLYDPHDPYEPPEPFASQYRGREYDGEVAYADAMLAQFFDFLTTRGWYEDALVIATGDHGEGLGQHGEETHGILLYDSTLHIPLVMKLARSENKGTSINRLVRTIDLFSTIVEAAGAEAPKNDGRSLFALLRRNENDSRDLVAETQYPLRFGWAPLHALRTPGHKLIEAPRAEFYDLRRDPEEKQNQYEPWKEDVRQLRSALAQHRKSAPRSPASDAKVSQSTLDELKALGYLGNDPGATQVPEPSLLPDPKDRIAVHNALHAAMMAEAAGDDGSALALFRRAADLEPDSFLSHSQAGSIELRTRNYQSAAQHLRRAFQLRATDASVALGLGEAMFALKEFADARQALAAGLKLDPRHYEARVRLGEVEGALGNTDAAVSHFEAAVLLAPDRVEADVAIGKLYIARREFDKALPHLRRAARKAPQNSEVTQLLAEAHREASAKK